MPRPLLPPCRYNKHQDAIAPQHQQIGQLEQLDLIYRYAHSLWTFQHSTKIWRLVFLNALNARHLKKEEAPTQLGRTEHPRKLSAALRHCMSALSYAQDEM